MRWAVQTMVGIVVKGYFAQVYVISNLYDVLLHLSIRYLKKIFNCFSSSNEFQRGPNLHWTPFTLIARTKKC